MPRKERQKTGKLSLWPLCRYFTFTDTSTHTQALLYMYILNINGKIHYTQAYTSTSVCCIQLYMCLSIFENSVPWLIFLQQILRRHVDEYIKNIDETLPRCKIAIKWTGKEDQLELAEFTCRVNLVGAKDPNNFFMIRFSPSSSASATAPAISRGQLV